VKALVSPLLSVPEVADRLGTSERFVRRLIAERRIPFYKLGTGRRCHVRIAETDLINYTAAGRIEAGI